MANYRTAPVSQSKMPTGIPFIVGNEAAERFSYYGMKAILVVFMTQYLVGANGAVDPMRAPEATAWFHLFGSAVYAFPAIGALISDALWGKYKTILTLSVVYCFGHLALALDETRVGLAVGLTLIAIGSGGIKPCVSAHVGDQFGKANKDLIPRVFQWFYFSVNLGSALATLLIPKLLSWYGPGVAFGLPGALMMVATWVFWLGRRRFVHIPPGGKAFVRETLSRQGLEVLGKLAVIYLFVAMFWALFEQTGSTWVLQAQKMDRVLLGIEWDAAQLQAANPALVMLLIPIFGLGVYPLINKRLTLNPLRKAAIGFFVAAASFAIPAYIETQISAGHMPTIAWQLLAYVLLTAAEIMISIPVLEFSYTQAPPRMKSVVMATYYLSITLGNLFTAAVNVFILNDDGSSKLTGASYYGFFAGAMLLTAVAFVGVAERFKQRTYLQDDDPSTDRPASPQDAQRQPRRAA